MSTDLTDSCEELGSSSAKSYYQFASCSVKYFSDSFGALQNYSVNDFVRDFIVCWDNITIFDILLITIFTVGWTLARQSATKYVFKPIGAYFQLSRSDCNKMPESGWKFIFYTCTWTSMAYVIFLKKDSQYFSQPELVWKDYLVSGAIPWDLYLIYVVQLSFYIHSIYASACIDLWRKDTPTMLLHHVLCVFLLFTSLATRSHRSGIFAMFLHDGCDILLEGSKLTRYFKNQGKRTVAVLDAMTNVGFACFTVAWFVCRLYWFPLRQMWTNSVYVHVNRIPVPFIFPINIMLWGIFAMNIYWFSFILKLLYKVATGQIKELEDNREYEEKEEINEKEKLVKEESPKKSNGSRYNFRERRHSLHCHCGRSLDG